MRFVDMGGLAAIQKRGAIRIAVLPKSPTPLQRSSAPARRDKHLAERFARSLDIEVQWVLTETRDELMELVENGHADLAAGNLTVTDAREERLAFARSTRTVDEVLVGKKGAAGNPRRLEELAGKKVYCWGNSSYAESLHDLARTKAPGLEVVAMRSDLDDETLLHLVSSAVMPLTVVDRNILEQVQRVDDDLVELFTVRADRRIAWALRKNNQALLAAASAFVVENAMDERKDRRSQGDLSEIRQRGALRVLMRNNSVSYFLHRGTPVGFEYELVRRLADDLGLRLEVVIPRAAEDLMPWLVEGRADLIAASFTVNEQREELIAFTTPYLYVDEVVVARKGHGPIASILALSKHKIHVRPSSSYAQTLEGLGLSVVPAAETMETEALIDLVGRGRIPLTVTDNHILGVELGYRTDIEQVLKLTHAPAGAVDTIGKPRSEAKSIAFGVRKQNTDLLAVVNRWVRKNYRGMHYNLTKRRYFERRAKSRDFRKQTDSSRISDYDELFKKYAAKYGLDWRLIAAQAWQESRFTVDAKSFAGARGLMQVMTATGREMGFTDLEDPDVSCHAGVKYLAKMIACFDERLPLDERIHFALASYNGGRGHVLDAMRLARRRGWNPDVWFGNVEKAILLLQDRQIAKTTRYGYCRGSEVVGYVKNIKTRYLEYVELVPR